MEHVRLFIAIGLSLLVFIAWNVLFVDKNMKSLQLFLNKVKDQFLTSYEGLLANYDVVEKFRRTIFSGFDLVLQKILD